MSEADAEIARLRKRVLMGKRVAEDILMAFARITGSG